MALGKKFKILVLIILLLALIPCVLLGVMYYQVTQDAALRIEKGALDQVVFSESPAYYDDGKTPIGVFFEKTHRRYIHYEEIPTTFIKAIVATEDKSFFEHWGFDPKSIFRAMIANFRSGRVVQGGSTITQQTAKNIFKREKRSYLAKLKELMQAFLLERRYTKEEILEMYSNQFFVTGYGNGLGIAAQYFFDKEVRDLDLVESAFIAGSVKGPNRYNPFIKKTQAEKDEVERLAKRRKDYVLSSMLKMRYIAEDEYLEAKERPVPFSQGRITYTLNVVLDYIREQLESEYFKKILEEQGVDNISTSGIRIYTSVNKETQEAALASLRSHLPLMEARLRGYDVAEMSEGYKKLAEGGLRKSSNGLPYLARITHIDTNGGEGQLVLSWENGGGVVQFDGLKPIGQAWLQWKKGGGVFDKSQVPAFLKIFKVGDLVPVRAVEGEEGTRLLLSRIPELDGGVVVLKSGMIKAMIGGFLDSYFNRAVDAKRQLGSIFKPIVYAAALQLKWNNLDTIPNQRDLFQFQETLYMPRPDHEPKSDSVSMAWAGTKSENLASVWLLYHLTDQLNMSEFKQVMDLLGFGRREGESYSSYQARIRDDYGIVVDEHAIREAAFREAKKETTADVIFSGFEDKAIQSLERLHFNIDPSYLEPEEVKENEELLKHSFKRYRELNLRMQVSLQRALMLAEQYASDFSPSIREALVESLKQFYRTDTERGEQLVFIESPEAAAKLDLFPVTPEWLVIRFDPIESSEILIEGEIPSEILNILERHTGNITERLLSLKRYDPEVLSKLRDFRVLVNLHYVVRLSRELGITTKLDPVLSFPLGANSISILEAALAYQSIMTGKVYPLTDEVDTAMVPVITKITDRNGEILWEYAPNPRRVLSERVSVLTTEILRNVMRHGTGRSARDAVQVRIGMDEVKLDVPIPTYGKTGTANRYTNSSFVGFFPGPDDQTGRFDLLDGCVVASYVGYDDNRPMKARQYAIYGSLGALPLWIDTANALVNSPGYQEHLEPAELAFDSVSFPRKGAYGMVRVSPVTGLPRSRAEGRISGPEVLTELAGPPYSSGLSRFFEPLGVALK